MGFQFPSNGKADPKKNIRRLKKEIKQLSFNSLQTGKRIQRNGEMDPKFAKAHVSIPFKRESGSKDWQRPALFSLHLRVSIPFKRESVSEQSSTIPIIVALLGMFQFPSNGKAYLNPTDEQIQKIQDGNSFNSLQTGKRI